MIRKYLSIQVKKFLIPVLFRLFFDLNPKLNREVKSEMAELPFITLSSFLELMVLSQNHQEPGLWEKPS